MRLSLPCPPAPGSRRGAIKVAVEHDGTRLDREAFGPVFSALVHAVRNAVDHGIEEPEERTQAQKPVQPTLTLSARHVGSQFLIEVADDGRGISWPRIAEKLRSLGRPAATHDQLVEGLFLDGLSTADKVTDVSGRGVGMAALRDVVESLHGKIEVSSNQGDAAAIEREARAIEVIRHGKAAADEDDASTDDAPNDSAAAAGELMLF